MWECLCGHQRPTPRRPNGQKAKWHWKPRSSRGKNSSGHSFQTWTVAAGKKYQHDESSGRENNSGVMRFCELRKLCCTSCVEKSCSRVAMERANNANLCDCTLACDPDIDAFFTFLWRRKCLSDHIQFVSVYLIASGLHNSRPAKWGQLHGLMGVISNLEGSLAVIDLQHNIVCLKNRKRSNMIAFIWNRLEAASWSIVTTPWLRKMLV